jgi:cold shock CspA family protein
MKAPMRNGASTYVTAQFVSSILAARPTAVGDVAETFSVVAATIARLLDPASGFPAPQPALRLQSPRQPRRRETAPSEQPAAVKLPKPTRQQAPAILTETPPTPKRRGRPPRSATVTVASVAEAIGIEAPTPSPRLLRRNDVTVPAAATAPVNPFERDPHAESKVKGVVKWFDTRSSKGVLRLTGMAGDIALEASLLAKSKIKRLYKDQEVEVTGAFVDGKFQPRSVTVPGQTQETLVTNGQVLHAAGRQSRPVFVEVKRANPRLQSARAEAEQAFGRTGTKSGL